MYINIFKEELEKYLNAISIKLEEKQIKQFYDYMNLLIEWNKKINLTAIIEPKEIILKHFVDSLTISKYINEKSTLIDVGTGAGFPGIPLKILRNDIKITLVDSLNKRIKFLDEVIKKLNLDNNQYNRRSLSCRFSLFRLLRLASEVYRKSFGSSCPVIRPVRHTSAAYNKALQTTR